MEPGNKHHESHSRLFLDVAEEREAIEYHLIFVLRLWHEGSDNYLRIADAVWHEALRLQRRARTIEEPEERRESLRQIGRILSVISFHNEYAQWVEGSPLGLVHGPPRGPIRSIRPGGLPGQGRRG